ncbi:MAG TPA: hypothetical protein PK052_05335 [Anaerohalosphaeraceae bacterium]|nr:hypothetical protein [Phycisphaerae bacterium]HOK94769.1 hypothetical protein [Anaerohalosphaeraceae bacterium]HOL31387.1 hypothetical protein [Anaerohalosphaeraceae bacterium]HOM76607.1 hypothetical protein [Anaerohalosphaeraceae bacterium]HPC64032.1 hypothetical protein [Anaerohalosphaeraceae bacterium]
MTDTSQPTAVNPEQPDTPDSGQLNRLREEIESLKADLRALQAAAAGGEAPGAGGIQPKTQGVRESLGAGRRAALERAARAAARSGSRIDVQEYMRIRRSFV